MRPKASLLAAAVAAALLLPSPATAQSAAAPVIGEASTPLMNNNSDGLASGAELLAEMRRLHAALAQVQRLLQSVDLAQDEEVMSKAAKLVRRVRSLVYATHQEMGRPGEASRMAEVERRRRENAERRRRARENRRAREGRNGAGEMARVEEGADAPRALLRRGGIGSGEVPIIEKEMEFEERALANPPSQLEDHVARSLFDETITFPECKEKFLNDCLTILNEQLVALQLDAEFIIHEKRSEHQDGYNKVVIVTDLTAAHVKGKLNDGIVEYPFPWDDAVEGVPRMLGIDGKWDCHALTPEACCSMILMSAPNADTRGNYLQCHMFVPFGGVGNKKRSDRVFINLSPDGRVHEAPRIS